MNYLVEDHYSGRLRLGIRMAESTTVEVRRKGGLGKGRGYNISGCYLVLTFLSNTIMNWSLPEVSGQYAGYGTISTAIRGTGSVTANLAYSVQISETRQIKSVLVKVGDMVQAGQVLFELEDAESDELQALMRLETMKINCLIKIPNMRTTTSTPSTTSTT